MLSEAGGPLLLFALPLEKIMGKFCIFPKMLAIFFFKMGTKLAILREKNGKLLGKIQNFPEMFP